MNDEAVGGLLATLCDCERQLELLRRQVAETYPGDNKTAWAVTTALKALNRLKLLIGETESAA